MFKFISFLILISFPFLQVGAIGRDKYDGAHMLDDDVQHTFETVSKQFRTHETEEYIQQYILETRVNKKFELKKDEPFEFTAEEALSIIKNDIPETFYERAGFGISNYFDIRSRLVSRFGLAKLIWDLEQDLLEKTRIIPRYLNEEDSDDDFDLIRNWNDIDKILFGSRSGITNAQFGKKDSTVLSKRSDLNGRNWQVGDPRNSLNPRGSNRVFANVKEKAFYVNGDDSIAGYLDKIKRSLGARWGSGGTTSQALLMGVEGRTIFQNNFVLPDIEVDGSPTRFYTPGKGLLRPEVHTIQTENEVQAFFEAIEDELLDRSRCENLYVGVVHRANVDLEKVVDECMLLRNIELDQRLEGITKTGNLNPEEIYGFRLSKILEMLDKHIWTFADEVKQMRKLLEAIATKKVINRKY